MNNYSFIVHIWITMLRLTYNLMNPSFSIQFFLLHLVDSIFQKHEKNASIESKILRTSNLK